MEKVNQTIQIRPPNIDCVTIGIIGDAPLVVHRFSQKAKNQMAQTMQAGSVAKKGRKREPANFEQLYQESKYVSTDNWEGFNCAAIRCAMISACRLVGFKMTLAKLSLFIEPDGIDKLEPEFGLIRIYGKSRKLESIARVETGAAYVCVRAIYDSWKANVKIRFDADQFSQVDVANLMARVGAQVGLGEGRPDSKNSAGMGWGVFHLATEKVEAKQQTQIAA